MTRLGLLLIWGQKVKGQKRLRLNFESLNLLAREVFVPFRTGFIVVAVVVIIVVKRRQKL